MLDTIESFSFEFMRSPFDREYPKHAGQFDTAVLELKKFFNLIVNRDMPFAVMSRVVDDLWHLFILHTPQYEAFCELVFGRYLHHQPRSAEHPAPLSAISNFFKEYPVVFGIAVPKIWFANIPRKLIPAVRRGEVPEEMQNRRWSGWPGWIGRTWKPMIET